MTQFAVGEVVSLWLPVIGCPSKGEWRKGVVVNFSNKGKNVYLASEDIRVHAGQEFEYPYTLKEREVDSK